MSEGLTWDEFTRHLDEYGIGTIASMGLEAVVIRTDKADFHVAAAHVDGHTLVIDLGQQVQP